MAIMQTARRSAWVQTNRQDWYVSTIAMVHLVLLLEHGTPQGTGNFWMYVLFCLSMRALFAALPPQPLHFLHFLAAHQPKLSPPAIADISIPAPCLQLRCLTCSTLAASCTLPLSKQLPPAHYSTQFCSCRLHAAQAQILRLPRARCFNAAASCTLLQCSCLLHDASMQLPRARCFNAAASCT